MHAIAAFAVLLAAGQLTSVREGSASGRIDAQGDGGQPWVVYVEKGPPVAKAPHSFPPKLMMQKDSQFQPGVAIVDAGATMEFLNVDNFYHNVFSPTPGRSFDLGLYRGGVKKTVTAGEPGEMDVYCNIHPQMHAKILVVPPEHVEAQMDGSYQLTGLAPGQYRLVAWSAAHEPVRKDIEILAGKDTRVDFQLSSRGTQVAHMNKDGEQYGRYK